ncbi:MAG: GAF domain-containing protein [Phycisphaerae bacterium]|nr:GAF domain-containing protein [Phycisphaerae bacterium]
MPGRDYTPLLDRLAGLPPDPDAAMARVTDALWDAFHADGLSWVGFYLFSSKRPDELTLGPRRDKPACSPIGMHGACGRAFRSRRPLVVTDVAHLGAGYIACDPRDRSEVVVPVFNPDGSAWGVLDADSHQPNAFDVFDALTLSRLLRHAGLSALSTDDPDDVDVV